MLLTQSGQKKDWHLYLCELTENIKHLRERERERDRERERERERRKEERVKRRDR